jgi:hypothetical protein
VDHKAAREKVPGSTDDGPAGDGTAGTRVTSAPAAGSDTVPAATQTPPTIIAAETASVPAADHQPGRGRDQGAAPARPRGTAHRLGAAARSLPVFGLVAVGDQSGQDR